jgi:hypothetical protein
VALRKTDLEKMKLENEIQIEENIDAHLAAAWNEFCKLEETHPVHSDLFNCGIHQCQQVIMWRELQRLKPDKYPTYAG